MENRFICGMLILMIVFSSGCSKKNKKCEILISNDMKKTLSEIAPTDEYGFFALTASCPKNLDELRESRLLICGKMEKETDVKLAKSSLNELNEPLFKSAQCYYIDQDLLSGNMVVAEEIKFSAPNDTTIKFPRMKLIYSKDILLDSLVRICFDEMMRNDHSIILMKRNNVDELPKGVRELFFHSFQKR